MPEQKREPDTEIGMLGLRIGQILLTERDKQHHATEMAQRTRANRSSTHRVLTRFEANRWVDRQTDKSRTLYKITKMGVQSLLDALSPFQIAPLSTTVST